MADLPRSTKATRRAAATFTAADIEAVHLFAGSLKAPGRALVLKVEAQVSGRLAREFLRANQPDSSVTFSPRTLKFFRGGIEVPRVNLKAVADAVSNDARFNIMDAALRLSQGKLEVAEWIVEHDRWLKVLHGTESALGRGGLFEMRPSDWVDAADRTAYQFGFSRAFAEDIAAGRYGVPGSKDFMADALLHRSQMYVNAGRCTAENTLTRNARDRLGHTHARRVLAAVQHCDDCIEVAGRGWIPIDDYPDVGTDACHSNCSCITITGFEGSLID